MEEYARLWALRFGVNPKTNMKVRYQSDLYNRYEMIYDRYKSSLPSDVRREYKQNKKKFIDTETDGLTSNERASYRIHLMNSDNKDLHDRLKMQNVSDKVIYNILRFLTITKHIRNDTREMINLYIDATRTVLTGDDADIFTDNVIDIMIDVYSREYLRLYDIYLSDPNLSKRLKLAMFHPDKCTTYSMFNINGAQVPHITTYLKNRLPPKYENEFCDKARELYMRYN